MFGSKNYPYQLPTGNSKPEGHKGFKWKYEPKLEFSEGWEVGWGQTKELSLEECEFLEQCECECECECEFLEQNIFIQEF